MLTYRQCRPLAGTHVAAYCAGMRNSRLQTDNIADLDDYQRGRVIGLKMPCRLAKKRATRILHEHRMNMRRWCSRGNVAASVAVPTDKGFTRSKKGA